MSEIHKTDLLVIGGGPGGYAAAFRAADLLQGTNKTVTLIEADDRLGGTCLLRGCIPSKTLLHVAALIEETRESRLWGIKYKEPEIDLPALREWKDGIITRLSNGLSGLVRQRKVTHIKGFAEFESSSRVAVKNNADVSHIDFKHAIIATGSRPVNIPMFAIDSPRVMDSSEALNLETIPKSMLVVGGGIIGLELGTVYAALGSEVTVVEMTDSLLPGTDRDLVKPLATRLSHTFKAIYTSTRVTHLDETNDGIEVHYEGEGKQFVETYDSVLLAIGRRPNTDHIGIENTKIEPDKRGFIPVDAQMRTKDKDIFAIGDAVPGPRLAHKATHEGHVAAEVIAGHNSAFNKVIPSVVYTDPEVAWVGLTETEARKQNRKIEVSRFPWAASGKAMALGRTEGLTKIIVDPYTQRVLGVGMVGTRAGDLIAEGVLAIEMAAVVEDIAHAMHAHPTLSETLGIAGEIYLGSATDIYMPKKK